VRLALALALVSFPAQSPSPPALAVGADCVARAGDYTLVRNDVLAKMDAAEENLAKAEAALAKAQTDLQALDAAFNKLQGQKTLLVEHIDLLERALKDQREACLAGQNASDVAAEAWEWVDAPLSFAAGAGACVGIAWGLTQATR
jgi:hypothetical protein